MAEDAERRIGRINGKWIVQVAVSVAILAGLFWYLPKEEILTALGRIRLPDLLTVFVVFVCGHVIAAGKWRILIGAVISLPVAIRAHLIGLTGNLCLPGVAGGDAVRAAVAYGASRKGGIVIAGGLADRMIDTMALAALALLGFWLAEGGAGQPSVAWVAVAVLILGPLLFFATLPPVLDLLWRKIPSLPARGLAAKISAEIRDLRKTPVRLILLLVLSVGIQALFIALSWHLARAIGLDVAYGAWMFAWAAAKLLAVVPISLGGLGVREAALAAFLAPYGYDAAMVVAAGMLWQVVLWMTGALGGVLFILTKPRNGTSQPEAEPHS
ncbi:MAG: lysylphosphatidylglycerol synthase transmembrane domain-containing protein [Marinibacterium sp.]